MIELVGFWLLVKILRYVHEHCEYFDVFGIVVVTINDKMEVRSELTSK